MFQNDKIFLAAAVAIGKFDVVKKLLKDGCSIDSSDQVSKHYDI